MSKAKKTKPTKVKQPPPDGPPSAAASTFGNKLIELVNGELIAAQGALAPAEHVDALAILNAATAAGVPRAARARFLEVVDVAMRAFAGVEA